MQLFLTQFILVDMPGYDITGEFHRKLANGFPEWHATLAHVRGYSLCLFIYSFLFNVLFKPFYKVRFPVAMLAPEPMTTRVLLDRLL